jgi:hypothetical protein
MPGAVGRVGARMNALMGGSSAWQPAVIGILAAQSALLYGYYLWGGMKELAGAMLVGAFAACAPHALDGAAGTSIAGRLRGLIPPLVVLWALVAALSSGGLIWVGPGGVVAVVVLFAHRGGLAALRARIRAAPRLAGIVAGVVAVAIALGAFLALRPGGFYQRFHSVLTSGTQLGNLAKPLKILQLAGIWPSQDFRYPSDSPGLAYVLIVVVLLAAAAGLVVAVRRLRRELVLYVACTLVAAVVVVLFASPWVGAKALASASPALPLIALVAAALLAARGRRALGVILGVVIALGIVWSNALGYHGVSLAPREQFAELAQIGHMISGQGPTLLNEYDTYGERYFLREATPDSVSDLRPRADLLATGKRVINGRTADIDQFQLSAILHYRTLVVQASPIAKRPPSPYKLIFHDRYWNVWQRPTTPTQHILALATTPSFPGTVASCKSLVQLGADKGATALEAAPVSNQVAVGLATNSKGATSEQYLQLDSAGVAHVPVSVHQAGTYSVWVGGSMHGPLSITVNGTSVGHVRNVLQYAGEFVPFGSVRLPAGQATLDVDYGGSDLLPGSGGLTPDTIGPFVLERQGPPQGLLEVAPKNARALCGRDLEWIEVLGS